MAKELEDAKALLIVNMGPSVCGFTESNLKQLEKFNKYLHKNGLRIIAFPCDQFFAKGVGQNGMYANKDKAPPEVY